MHFKHAGLYIWIRLLSQTILYITIDKSDIMIILLKRYKVSLFVFLFVFVLAPTALLPVCGMTIDIPPYGGDACRISRYPAIFAMVVYISAVFSVLPRNELFSFVLLLTLSEVLFCGMITVVISYVIEKFNLKTATPILLLALFTTFGLHLTISVLNTFFDLRDVFNEEVLYRSSIQ
jgi:hypothetical protein